MQRLLEEGNYEGQHLLLIESEVLLRLFETGVYLRPDAYGNNWSRWNNYKTDARKAGSGNMESCKQQSLQNNFLQDDLHEFLEDIEVKLIDKTQASDPNKRVLLDENPENFVS